MSTPTPPSNGQPATPAVPQQATSPLNSKTLSRAMNMPDSATTIGDLLEHLELVAADLAHYESQLTAAPVHHAAMLADARKLVYKAEVLRQTPTTHYELYHH